MVMSVFFIFTMYVKLGSQLLGRPLLNIMLLNDYKQAYILSGVYEYLIVCGVVSEITTFRSFGMKCE